MNAAHLKLCGSDAWADAVKRWIIPDALDGIDLGDEVLEIGPGPGRTTEVLREMARRLTAVEIDGGLAAALAARLGGGAVRVVRGDGTALPFSTGRFTAALSFTMLHHVPSIAAQDRLLAEVARVLRPGGVLAGVDSKDSEEFRALHVDDICVPLDPATLAARLTAAGFATVRVEPNPYVIQFRAWV
ncbi:MAG TPA: class I SAM-dependent methyltransferase [Dehalococcoidia bacterium]|nr:class I SAM-dependent methyltransferase [Dehalococcoidia bacterium]